MYLGIYIYLFYGLHIFYHDYLYVIYILQDFIFLSQFNINVILKYTFYESNIIISNIIINVTLYLKSYVNRLK